MSAYAWIITHVNTRELGEDMGEEVGIAGPRDASDELLASLKAGEGYTFRMLDDDGIWYYRGRIVFAPKYDMGAPELSSYSRPEDDYYIVGGGLAWMLEDACFAPLNDFGTPNAGAVHLQYRCVTEEGDRVWATL